MWDVRDRSSESSARGFGVERRFATEVGLLVARSDDFGRHTRNIFGQDVKAFLEASVFNVCQTRTVIVPLQRSLPRFANACRHLLDALTPGMILHVDRF